MSVTAKPSIHLNGTGKADLETQLRIAGRSLIDAIGALSGASPNARDYYPQGPDAYPVAREEHKARILAVQAVLKEIESLYEHVADAPERNSR